MKKVTVKMSTWDRGDGSEGELLTVDGNMCCLGFVALQSGLRKKDIYQHCTPDEVQEWRKFPSSLLVFPKDQEFVADSPVCSKMIGINDDPHISDKMRMYKLNQLKGKSEIEFTFIP